MYPSLSMLSILGQTALHLGVHNTQSYAFDAFLLATQHQQHLSMRWSLCPGGKTEPACYAPHLGPIWTARQSEDPSQSAFLARWGTAPETACIAPPTCPCRLAVWSIIWACHGGARTLPGRRGRLVSPVDWMSLGEGSYSIEHLGHHPLHPGLIQCHCLSPHLS
jgi:hypothetical protein